MKRDLFKAKADKHIQYLKMQAVIENGDLAEGFKSRLAIRNALLRIRGNKCEICGVEEWTGVNDEPRPILLVMDHINGDSSDNKLSNVRLVCSNCDATLPTYKSKNKGNGRHSRRQRYADGKSY